MVTYVSLHIKQFTRQLIRYRSNYKMKLPDLSIYMPTATTVAYSKLACDCYHNGDAGRWRDTASPDGRVADLCKNGGGTTLPLQNLAQFFDLSLPRWYLSILAFY